MKKIYSSLIVAGMIGFSGCDGASRDNPTITLKGEKNVEIQLGTYSIPEAGATASDEKDGDLTNSIVRDHNINFNKAGEYQITYDVTDSDGNTAHAVRHVTIVDAYNGNGGYYNGGQTYKGAIPVITFPDGDPVYLALGQTFDKTYTAYDVEDGDLGAKVEIEGAGFDANTEAGAYVVTYKVTDSDGNFVEKKRTVFVGQYGTGNRHTWNNTTEADIQSFTRWYSMTCGQVFDRSKYNANTGYYDGDISCSQRNLFRIDLTDMQIFSTIKSVDFSHNNLESIDLTPFYKTNVIEKVDLSYNKFTDIDFRPLYALKNINELRLNNNQLHYTKEERIELYKGFNNRSFNIFF